MHQDGRGRRASRGSFQSQCMIEKLVRALLALFVFRAQVRLAEQTITLGPGDGQLLADAIAEYGTSGENTTVLLPRGQVISLVGVTIKNAQASAVARDAPRAARRQPAHLAHVPQRAALCTSMRHSTAVCAKPKCSNQPPPPPQTA